MAVPKVWIKKNIRLFAVLYFLRSPPKNKRKERNFVLKNIGGNLPSTPLYTRTEWNGLRQMGQVLVF